MKKLISVFILIIAISSLNAQPKIEEENVTKTIHNFFEGLQNGDTITLNKVINKELKLQSIFLNKEGKNTLISETKEAFLKAISSKNPADVWFEKLLSLDIKIDGNLASVWAPYEFFFNNEFSHCGVNSFQLFKNDNNWVIIYIVDTRRKKCN